MGSGNLMEDVLELMVDVRGVKNDKTESCERE